MLAPVCTPHPARLWRLLAPLWVAVVLLALTPAWGLLRNGPKLERAASLSGTALPTLNSADPGTALPTLNSWGGTGPRHLLAAPIPPTYMGMGRGAGFPGKPLRLFLAYGRLLLEGA